MNYQIQKMQILNNMKGKFIVFEGLDCSGKSTQIKKVFNTLKDINCNVIKTFEPGGSELGQELRNLLKHSNIKLDNTSEFLLFSAARRHLIDNLIIPELNKGTVILCDRFYLSTLCYQEPYKNLSSEKSIIVKYMEELVFNSIFPDLTFIFDISAEESLKRKNNREVIHDRFENQQRLEIASSNYLNITKFENSNKPIYHIDGTLDEDTIFNIIMKHINKLL